MIRQPPLILVCGHNDLGTSSVSVDETVLTLEIFAVDGQTPVELVCNVPLELVDDALGLRKPRSVVLGQTRDAIDSVLTDASGQVDTGQPHARSHAKVVLDQGWSRMVLFVVIQITRQEKGRVD
jgi:hypothetical protein